MTNKQLIDKLNETHALSENEWTQVIGTYDAGDLAYAMELAHGIALERFGRKIYFRGIVEFTNICRNDCYYCGIRCSNTNAQRYRLDEDDILASCRDGYANGFRTFVLAGCNVVMPNLSPMEVRKKYMLYDGKVGTDMSAAAGIAALRSQMEEIGYEVVVGRGDFKARN